MLAYVSPEAVMKVNEFYYEISGEFFSCCGEYQNEAYCYAHNTEQGCAFCSGYTYWEACKCEGDDE